MADTRFVTPKNLRGFTDLDATHAVCSRVFARGPGGSRAKSIG